jgi:hypothetical protein
MATDVSTDDLKAVCEALVEGKSIDPAMAQRIHEEAMQLRDDVYRKHGLLNIAAELTDRD